MVQMLNQTMTQRDKGGNTMETVVKEALDKMREYKCDCKTDYKETCILRSKVDGACLHHFTMRLYPRAFWPIIIDGAGFCRLDVLDAPPCLIVKGEEHWRYIPYRAEYNSFCCRMLSEGEDGMLEAVELKDNKDFDGNRTGGRCVTYVKNDMCRLTLAGTILALLNRWVLCRCKLGWTLKTLIDRHYPGEFFVAE